MADDLWSAFPDAGGAAVADDPFAHFPDAGPAGQIKAGNIDLNNRPIVKNADGTISTVRSISANVGGKEVLLPTVSDGGKIMSNEDAVKQYSETGRHLGIFDTPENATAYAEQLHQSQAEKYDPFSAFPNAASDHSDKWNQDQADMAARAKSAGIPDAPDARQRLTDAISRTESAGFQTPHFIGTPDEPTGDRAVTRDIENLTSSLKSQEASLPAGPQRDAISKQRAYWEQEAANGMSAGEWRQQTGDPEPLYPHEKAVQSGTLPNIALMRGGQTTSQPDSTTAPLAVAKILDLGKETLDQAVPGLFEQATTSPLPATHYQPETGDSTATAAKKAALNKVTAAIEAGTSPAMLATFAAGGAIPDLGRVLGAVFGVTQAAEVPGQIEQAFTAPTTQGKIEGGLGATIDALFAAGGVKATKGDLTELFKPKEVTTNERQIQAQGQEQAQTQGGVLAPEATSVQPAAEPANAAAQSETATAPQTLPATVETAVPEVVSSPVEAAKTPPEPAEIPGQAPLPPDQAATAAEIPPAERPPIEASTTAEKKSTPFERIAAAQRDLKAAKASGDAAGEARATEELNAVAAELTGGAAKAREQAQTNLTTNPEINPTRDVTPETVLDPTDTEMVKKAADSLGLRYDGIQGEDAINITNTQTGDTYTMPKGSTVADLTAKIDEKAGQRANGKSAAGSETLGAGNEPATQTPVAGTEAQRVRAKSNSFQIPHEPLGAPDIVDILSENGGIKSRGKAGGPNADLWNDQPDLRGVYRQLLGGKLAPDQMAAIAAEHGFGDGTVTSMWQELDKAVQARRSMRTQAAAQAKEQSAANAKDKAFSRDVLKPDDTRDAINTANLVVGDKMKVGDAQFKVTAIDPNTLDVTLEDGKKYGVQQVQAGQALYVDSTDIVPREQDVAPTTPTLRPGENQGDLLSKQQEDLTLVGEKGTDFAKQADEKTALATAKEEAKALQDRQQGKFPEIEKTNDWTEATLPELKSEPAPSEPSSQALGIVPPGVAKLAQMQSSLGTALKGVAGAVRNIAKFSDFRKSVLKWSATNQKATGEIFKVSKDILKSVPDASRREGITNWIQAGGDVAELQRRAAATTDARLKKGYEAAANLTPAEIALAGKIRKTYDILLQRARAYGIEINELPDYVNQLWKRQPIKDFISSSNRKLSTSIRFAKERYHDSFFNGEQSGLKPETKDIAKLLPIYMNEVNNAISAKQFVADMARGKASDGRPLLAPTGMVKTIDNPPGNEPLLQGGIPSNPGKTYLVLPEMRTKETVDYKALDGHPALRDWRWRAQDEAGNPILVQGDLRIHPEVYSHLKNVLSQSAIREWYRSANENPLGAIPKEVTKFLIDDMNQTAKATMLGFVSPFHQVQEGTHAVGHRVNPFSDIPKIDLSDAKQMDAASHGLMLLPDRVSADQFREGLDGSKRNLVASAAGKFGGKPGALIKRWADGYQDYLFHQYIPGLKLKTYEHILPRNMDRYADQIGRGDVTEDQVKYLSSQQANAAYGHLNYADMGRNPTIQHLMQVFLLAPDFLEARGRFVGQALKPSLAGREQLAALATLAVTQFVLSRALNKTLDDDYHWDSPFDVIVGNRRYGMRSVPADIAHAFSNTRQFVSGRLSPVVGRGLLEGLSGVNYRREPTTIGQTVNDIITGMIPITLQPATRGLSETGKDNPVSPVEQFLGSLGLHVSRFSPVSKVYSLAKDWVEEHGKDYGIDKREAVFPISKYQQFRYALEDGNIDKAKAEYERLMTDGKIDAKEFGKRFQMALYHPFTGSKKTDQIFQNSLDQKDRKVFDDAVKRREILWSRYESIAGMGGVPKSRQKIKVVQ